MVTDMEKDAKAMLETAKQERLEMSKKAEAKGAAPAPSAEIKKTEEKKEESKADDKSNEVKIQEAEAKAKKDEEILSKKDDELKDDEKARKAELVKIKDAEGKTNVQKRFDELTAKIKDLESDRNSTKAEKEALAEELNSIKKKLSITPEDKSKEEIKAEMQVRNKKYVDEDKEKPREDRREMAKEELDEWLLEDYEGANEWLTRRSIRRYQEENHLKQDKANDRQASEIMKKQNRSAEKTYQKHPELNMFKRAQELKTQGKTKDEVLQILFKESPKFKVYMDIVNENADKYMLAENGPELIVEEMEKRLTPSKETSEVEDLKKRIADLEEAARLREVDGEISSTRYSGPKPSEPEIVKKTEELGEELGLSKDVVKKALERRKGVR